MTSLRLCIALIAFATLAHLSAAGGPRLPQSSAPDKAAANSAYEAKDWAKAERLYSRITAAEPTNTRAWYRLGVARHSLGQNEQAISALQKALENGARPPLTEYQISLCYAGLHGQEKALQFLEQATQHGFSD